MKDISLAAKAFRLAQKARFSQCMGQSDPNALYLTLERTSNTHNFRRINEIPYADAPAHTRVCNSIALTTTSIAQITRIPAPRCICGQQHAKNTSVCIRGSVSEIRLLVRAFLPTQ
jgi:hypothetical protein